MIMILMTMNKHDEHDEHDENNMKIMINDFDLPSY